MRTHSRTITPRIPTHPAAWNKAARLFDRKEDLPDRFDVAILHGLEKFGSTFEVLLELDGGFDFLFEGHDLL
jgi:hypothetical protein